jgi:peroxiredoxin
MSITSRMRISGKKLLLGCVAVAAPLLPATFASAATPTPEQALALKPMQKDVDYDKPAEGEVAKCTIKVEKGLGTSGWIVYDPTGQIIRRFTDTNGDNVVDLWSYFSGGAEVYRDVDTNNNGKADQFRWLNTAGTRWGLDADEDGKIDSWKSISAEEVSSEAVAAMGSREESRFLRLLLTADELKSLGLGDELVKVIGEKIASAPKKFTALPNDEKTAMISSGDSRWLNFSGTRPSAIPSGTNGSTKDVTVYENIITMFESKGKNGQLQIGTMIKIGDGWRLIDVPQPVDELATNDRGIFTNQNNPVPGVVPPGPDGKTAPGGGSGLPEDLAKLDEEIGKTNDPKQLAVLKKKKCDLIENALAGLTKPEDREIWIRQLIDTCAEGAQTNTYTDGLARLKDLEKKLIGNDREHAPYCRFSVITSEYMSAMNSPEGAKEFNKIQAKWLDDLKLFVKDFPKSKEAADALSHLAIDSEFAGKEEDAKKLYTEIAVNFPGEMLAAKAAGAVRRLDSIDKSMVLAGTTVEGKPFDIKSLSGKFVVVYYWSSIGHTTAGDVAQLKQVQAKFARDNVAIVGVSLDNSPETLSTFLQANRLPWIVLHEKGGMDGRFAQEMGIFTVPTVMLVDSSGKVVARNLEISLLDKELSDKIRK